MKLKIFLMTQIQKLIEKFLKNPASLRYQQLEKVLVEYVFERIEAKGSHKKFKHLLLNRDLIIPVHNGDCKDFYKKEALKFIKLIPSDG